MRIELNKSEVPYPGYLFKTRELSGLLFVGRMELRLQYWCQLFWLLCLVISTSEVNNLQGVVKSKSAGTSTRHYTFTVDYANFTRLNHTKSMLVVNGQFPGPAISAHEGDIIIVNVTNLAASPITIHWHGVKQLGTCWSDGVPYITMCPIQQNQSFSHRFQLLNQTGTMWYHAHMSWLRATIHGPIVLQPRDSQKYPFLSPNREITIMLGEWWNNNVEDIIAEALATGGGYNISDALTINGQPGFLYNFSSEGAHEVKVVAGETYLLRLVNCCLNFELFFAVANHSLNVVQLDSAYVEPFTVDTVVIAPGQSLDALLTANHSSGKYLMATSVYSVPAFETVPFPNIPATARMDYEGSAHDNPIHMPTFPDRNDTSFHRHFESLQKCLNTTYQTLHVPQNVDKSLLFTVGFGLDSSSSCPPLDACIHGYQDQYRILGAVNNVSFVAPSNTTKSLLEYAYLQGLGDDQDVALDLTFPSQPETTYNYTGPQLPLSQWFSKHATQLSVIDFNSSVQIVLQNTHVLVFETHPFHLHGYSFYVVGKGSGNYDPDSSPASFNLVNPPFRNTIVVPHQGWIALRFQADNPGVWLFHCHFEIHTSWGMETLLYVKEGTGEGATLEAPPSDYPACVGAI